MDDSTDHIRTRDLRHLILESRDILPCNNHCGVLVIPWILGARMEQDKEGPKEELFDLPKGFIGWTGNINHPVLMFKIRYCSNATSHTLENFCRVMSACRADLLLYINGP